MVCLQTLSSYVLRLTCSPQPSLSLLYAIVQRLCQHNERSESTCFQCTHPRNDRNFLELALSTK